VSTNDAMDDTNIIYTRRKKAAGHQIMIDMHEIGRPLMGCRELLIKLAWPVKQAEVMEYNASAMAIPTIRNDFMPLQDY